MTVLGIVTFIGVLAFGLWTWGNLVRENPRKAAIVAALVVGFLALIISGGGLSFGEVIDGLGGDRMNRVYDMLATVLLSVIFCIGIWVVANVFVDQARGRWTVFSALTGAALGAVFFGLLRGNKSVGPLVSDVAPEFQAADPLLLNDAVGTGLVGNLEWPILGAVLFGAGGYAMKSLPNRLARLGLGAAIGVVAGWFVARNTRILQRPDPDWIATILATAILGGIGFVLGRRSGSAERYGLIGAGVGFAVGSWLLSPFAQIIDVPYLPTMVPLALIMMGAGWQQTPQPRERAQFDSRARAVIFLAPALLFLTGALIVPTIRTGILSFKDRTAASYIGWDNYESLFTDDRSFDTSNWTNIFSSQLFFVAVILALIGVAVGLISYIRRNGEPGFEGNPTSIGALLFGAFILSFAVLTVLRGTFFNNIWWVIVVVTLATVFGLAIAVLADRASFGENAAKSLIFMPMAVSFVGASIVWRFQYQPRETSKTQTGVLNAIWVELGRLSNSGWPRTLVMIVLAALLAWAVYAGVQRIRAGRPFTFSAIMVFLLGWLLYRFAGPRLGGFEKTADGEIVPDTILFLTETPFNNVWLMVILIWMQTGFAMVILSAAIKAVPTEFVEAARVDGATDAEVFFNVTLPSILPTVGVVVTTMIVQVTKVYDIVKVAGQNGIFGNDVLANQMFNESFQIGDIGLGAAIAMVMFASLLPVMVYNIRSMQKAGV